MQKKWKKLLKEKFLGWRNIFPVLVAFKYRKSGNWHKVVNDLLYGKNSKVKFNKVAKSFEALTDVAKKKFKGKKKNYLK